MASSLSAGGVLLVGAVIAGCGQPAAQQEAPAGDTSAAGAADRQVAPRMLHGSRRPN